MHYSSTNTPRTLFFLCEISHYCKILDFFFLGCKLNDFRKNYQNYKKSTLRITLFIYMVQVSSQKCRNPTLAKCGGEAQHFQS